MENGGKMGCWCKKNSTKLHNDPKCSTVADLFAFTTNLNSSQFPKGELNSQSIGKQKGNLKGSASTRQRQRGDLQGLTNPHILQQQHPLGALEPSCILVNHTPPPPHQYVARSDRCSLNATFSVHVFSLRGEAEG